MPTHDWTRGTPGLFHYCHHAWIFSISKALNDGLLPSGYYAMAEQVAGGVGPVVLALERSPRERKIEMPIHDWTRVTPGIFHDFHHEWISTIKRSLNGGLLPSGYYAMAEQIAGGVGPDVLALEMPEPRPQSPESANEGGLAIATRPPKVRYHHRQADWEAQTYAQKAKAVVIRHSSDHRVVAMVEIVSPGNKSSRGGIEAFAGKAREMMRAGIHLLIVDLFPPGPRDPNGLHAVIWDIEGEGDFPLPEDEPLACVAYLSGMPPQVFLEPVAVGRALPEEMPLFLSEEIYVPVPLDTTYREAWEAVPEVWRATLAPTAD